MKTEDQAWRDLQAHASSQLRSNFADHVLRAVQGPRAEAWQQLQVHAAARIRPGFAERVLRAARQLPGVPSLLDQLAFSAAAAAVCVLAAVFIHARSVRLEDERNLASWQEIAHQVEDLDNAR
jgi:hypothetical protein